MDYLSSDFLVELMKTCLTTPSFTAIASKNLAYHYMPTEPFKKVWREIKTCYDLDSKPPTIGVLRERLKGDVESESVILEIKKCVIDESKYKIIEEFEKFLKVVQFKELYDKTTETYNEGSREKAIDLLVKGAEKIGKFSLQSQTYSTVFKSFEERNSERQDKAFSQDLDKVSKIPFGIHPLDYYTKGGGDTGRSSLFMAISGGGKSTLLRWLGVSAARMGFRVVHFQCEGTEDEALDAYDACWTGVDLEDIELGNIPISKKNLIRKVNQDMINGGGEIFVIASEQFNNLTIEECDNHVAELTKTYGKIHLAIFDYLELFQTTANTGGDERARRNKIAEGITNIAVKWKLHSAAATQANDIKKVKQNDPDYVMTRNDISEFKGLVKPFSYFITVNQTEDEYETGVVRLYNDKFRKYKSGQTFKIAQSLTNSRFYDSKRTLNLFWDSIKNKPIN